MRRGILEQRPWPHDQNGIVVERLCLHFRLWSTFLRWILETQRKELRSERAFETALVALKAHCCQVRSPQRQASKRRPGNPPQAFAEAP